ncbi:MAG: DUF4956 domain-containing protein [Firmicutes bacterium]|nr:DUF4956 domain-containing protein [Bacillota bacterium]
MLDTLQTLLFTSLATELNLGNFLILLVSAIALGFLTSVLYIITHKDEDYAPSFPTTLIMLPVITALIVLLVGTNIATAFSVGGAFALIRFRSAPGDPKDIAYTFMAVGIGVCCGVGYWAYGLIFTLLMCAVLLLVRRFHWGQPKEQRMNLKILVPETMNYIGLFDDILKKYTLRYTLNHIKTADFGSLCELKFTIVPKPDFDSKEFIDALRCRNGNLNINLNVAPNVSFGV